MVKQNVGFDAVRKMGLALPEVAESKVYGSPALKVRGRMFACIAIHRSAEPDTLAVRIEFDERDELIRTEPDIYYLTDHYVNYPCVLVRLRQIHPDALRDLLLMGWRFMSTTKRLPIRKRRRNRGSRSTR
jgi:hypothetical protein